MAEKTSPESGRQTPTNNSRAPTLPLILNRHNIEPSSRLMLPPIRISTSPRMVDSPPLSPEEPPAEANQRYWGQGSHYYLRGLTHPARQDFPGPLRWQTFPPLSSSDSRGDQPTNSPQYGVYQLPLHPLDAMTTSTTDRERLRDSPSSYYFTLIPRELPRPPHLQHQTRYRFPPPSRLAPIAAIEKDWHLQRRTTTDAVITHIPGSVEASSRTVTQGSSDDGTDSGYDADATPGTSSGTERLDDDNNDADDEDEGGEHDDDDESTTYGIIES